MYIARSVSTMAASAALILLSACGGGGSSGGGTSNGGSNTGGTAQTITETAIPIPVTTRVVQATDPGGSSRTDLSSATYQIVLFWSSPNGTSFNNLLGTGFAVGGDLIATNAHVSGEVLNQARNFRQFGFSLTKVSAFRAETGEEVPLLEALVHPSYNGSTRSPDVGLFVARSQLPVALELASNAEIRQLRAGTEITLNGFPGDVNDAIFARGFMPGLSIPQATLFTGNIQSLQKFDERSVIDQSNPLSIDMIQHSMDTSPGTSGSPILSRGKVVAVHNSGLSFTSVNVGADGRPVASRQTQATASWGVHMKHLRNLLAEYDTGVMEADKRYRLPPDPGLVAAGGANTGAGQGNNQSGTTPGAGSLNATVVDPETSGALHQISISVDQASNISGTSSWPASVSNGQPARSFTLTGSIKANGQLEFVDNTPEIIPGFRRGLYIGNINPASGTVIGEYYEQDSAGQLFYFGDWTGKLN